MPGKDPQAGPSPLKIDTTAATDGSIVVTVVGEVDLSSAPELERALGAAQRTETGQVTVDLAGVSFIDSTGLRAILTAARNAHRLGQTIVAENTRPHIRRLFELTAVDKTVQLRTGSRT